MIYENMIIKRGVFDLSDVTFQESVAMIEYMNESNFLVESASASKIVEVTNRFKKLEAKIRSNEYDKKEIEEEIEDLYEIIKSIGNIEAAKEDERRQVKWEIFLVGLVNFIMAYISAGISTTAAITSGIIGSLLVAISCIQINPYTYDNAFDILVRSESKFMVARRKALKEDNKENLKMCDKIIEIIEDLKSKRRAEYKKPTNEATIVNESDKNEEKIYNFKQSLDEINHYLTVSYDWLKLMCTTTKAMIKKANSITKNNGDKVCNEIIDIGEEGNKKAKSLEMVNVNLADNLFRKWGNTISAKYSPYGMEVREKFEKRLAEFNDEIIEYLNKFYDEISIEVTGKKGTSINKVSNELYDKMRKTAGIAIADRINGGIASWYNAHQDEYKFLDNEIRWAKSVVNSAKIKNTLRYKIFSKIVK